MMKTLSTKILEAIIGPNFFMRNLEAVVPLKIAFGFLVSWANEIIGQSKNVFKINMAHDGSLFETGFQMQKHWKVIKNLLLLLSLKFKSVIRWEFCSPSRRSPALSLHKDERLNNDHPAYF